MRYHVRAPPSKHRSSTPLPSALPPDSCFPSARPPACAPRSSLRSSSMNSQPILAFNETESRASRGGCRSSSGGRRILPEGALREWRRELMERSSQEGGPLLPSGATSSRRRLSRSVAVCVCACASGHDLRWPHHFRRPPTQRFGGSTDRWVPGDTHRNSHLRRSLLLSR